MSLQMNPNIRTRCYFIRQTVRQSSDAEAKTKISLETEQTLVDVACLQAPLRGSSQSSLIVTYIFFTDLHVCV
jgi:hypothetical protein